jgi:hypothetical protein
VRDARPKDEEAVMKSLRKAEERGLRSVAAACYLISLTMCGAAAYALAQVAESAAGGAVRQLYPTAGMF